MKSSRILLLIVFLTSIMLFNGCHAFNKWQEDTSFETVTGKTVNDLKLYSGNSVVAYFKTAKVTYSASNSDTFFFVADGKKYYWMPGALMEIK